MKPRLVAALLLASSCPANPLVRTRVVLLHPLESECIQEVLHAMTDGEVKTTQEHHGAVAYSTYTPLKARSIAVRQAVASDGGVYFEQRVYAVGDGVVADSLGAASGASTSSGPRCLRRGVAPATGVYDPR